MFSSEEIRLANARGAKRLSDEPRVVTAKFDPALRRIILVLNTRAWLSFAPEDAQGLEFATDAQLKKIVLGPYGLAVDFPLLDVQFELRDLMLGNFGTSQWMAQRAAAAALEPEAEASAAPTNGKLGGRPRKSVAS